MSFIATGARHYRAGRYSFTGTGWFYSRAVGDDVKMNPKDLRKAAPILGALLLAAIIFIVVRSLL
jgi:hypothetical protein